MSSQSQSTQTPAPSSTISIPATAAAGGISFTAPAERSPMSIYKIQPSAPITFGWNYTSLYSTPSALTVSLFCSDNLNTYDLTTLTDAQTAFTWDVQAWQDEKSVSLSQAVYTLQVMDYGGLQKAARPGLFTPNTNLKFGLYRGASYQPLSEWTCPGCSAATSLRDNISVVGATVSLALITMSALGFWRRRD